jgi:hypothetical protein
MWYRLMKRRAALLDAIARLNGARTISVDPDSKTPRYDRNTGMAYDSQKGLMYNPDNFLSRSLVTNWLQAYSSVLFPDKRSVRECMENAECMKDIHALFGWESREQAERGLDKTCVLAVAFKEE